MQEKKPTVKLKYYLHICIMLISVIIFACGMIFFENYPLLLWLIFAVVIALWIVLALYLPHLWKNINYLFCEDFIIAESGVIWHKKKFIRTEGIVGVAVVKLPFSAEKISVLRTIGGKILVLAKVDDIDFLCH